MNLPVLGLLSLLFAVWSPVVNHVNKEAIMINIEVNIDYSTVTYKDLFEAINKLAVSLCFEKVMHEKEMKMEIDSIVNLCLTGK